MAGAVPTCSVLRPLLYFFPVKEQTEGYFLQKASADYPLSDLRVGFLPKMHRVFPVAAAATCGFLDFTVLSSLALAVMSFLEWNIFHSMTRMSLQ